jgi:soluble lytic murein transglycosylase
MDAPVTPGGTPRPTPLSKLRNKGARNAPAPSPAAPSAATPAGRTDLYVAAPQPGDDLVREAKLAFTRKDRARLSALRDQVIALRHPLAPWVDYWDLTARLMEVSSPEVEAFYARWPGSYQEDRLRNDWLLELGHRRDWSTLAREYPRFRMNDDREVSCYMVLVDWQAGRDVAGIARAAWHAQRDADEGCQLLAQTLLDAKVFTEEDVWRRLRKTAEFNKPRAAKAAAQMLSKSVQRAIGAIWDNPAHWLAHKADAGTSSQRQLVAIALARMAASDPLATATQLASRWDKVLGKDLSSWTWAIIAKQAAMSQRPEALDATERAWADWKPPRRAAAEPPDWGDDAIGWQARASLRFATGAARWRGVLRATDAMTPTERADPTWVYWRARAHDALAKDGPVGDAERAAARAEYASIASPLTFYGLLAAEELDPLPPALPPRPLTPSQAERDQAHANPGFRRALNMAALDLRDEARREWNFTLRGLSDRELFAGAQWACEAADWQICINTSERSKVEIDVGTRYVMPYANEIAAASQSAGVDPALALGLIRQETRFMGRSTSAVGASGLMQLMPPTARWVAKKSGLDYTSDQIHDPAVNLKLGTTYLRMVLDSFGGSVPMAAAAYNAGPSRPRRWRDGPVIEPAIWIENVPFNETRDYVKKVSTNYAVYTALITGRPAPLKPRLGPPIGPLGSAQPAGPADLP